MLNCRSIVRPSAVLFCQYICVFTCFYVLTCVWVPLASAQQIKMQIADQDNRFHFLDIASPSNSDAGSIAKIFIAGRNDRNSAPLSVLNDGQLPDNADQPQKNFFLAQQKGRILFDLGEERKIQSIRCYSWHPSTRLDQRYSIWTPAKPTKATDKQPTPEWKDADDLADAAWTQIASVDTRSLEKQNNRPLATEVSAESHNTLATTRYVLLEIKRPNPDQRFGDTFFSEIDVEDGREHEAESQVDSIRTDSGAEIIFDTSDLPEIRPWVNKILKPACLKWYPKISERLASKDFQPPQKFTIFFHRKMDGVAYTQGKDVHCAGVWYQRNLNGEALGATIHELVHVVQQYPGGRRRNRNPGWMVEGVADYIRWFQFEPEKNRPRPNFSRANFDDSYRTSAAFLDFVIRNYDQDLLAKFNTAMRERKYDDQLWVEWTGKSPEQLWQEYRTEAEKKRQP